MAMESDLSKLFVGGISRETTEDTLREHFSKYSTVLESVIAKDRLTGNPRGFGFVSLSDPSSLLHALQDSHVILGRTVDVKKAVPRTRNEEHQNLQQQQQQNRSLSESSTNGSSDSQFRTQKIFVGGLSTSLTEEEFKSYFERFGRITDVVVMHDSTTHRPRGFGFVTFDSEESVENVMQKSFHELNGRVVEVKKAVPKEGNHGSSRGYNTRVHGGRGAPVSSYIPGPGSYPPYSPGYWAPSLPGYAPVPGYNGAGGYAYGTGMYRGGYPLGGYTGTCYGPAPQTPWNFPVNFGARGFLLPYGYAPINPAGVMGTPAGAYDVKYEPGVTDKGNEVVSSNGPVPVDMKRLQINGVKSDAESSGLKGSNGMVSNKHNKKGMRALPCR